MLDAMVGHDPMDPLSFESMHGSYVVASERNIGPVRIAFSEDMNMTAVDPRVSKVFRHTVGRLREKPLHR